MTVWQVLGYHRTLKVALVLSIVYKSWCICLPWVYITIGAVTMAVTTVAVMVMVLLWWPWRQWLSRWRCCYDGRDDSGCHDDCTVTTGVTTVAVTLTVLSLRAWRNTWVVWFCDLVYLLALYGDTHTDLWSSLIMSFINVITGMEYFLRIKTWCLSIIRKQMFKITSLYVLE